MDIEALLQQTKLTLPTARFEHTIRVHDTAVRMATQRGINIDKVRVAAILHDYCKFWSKDQLAKWIQDHKLPADLFDYHHALWHAPVGAEVAAVLFGIDDEEILQAIRYHTTGRPRMSPVEKVIFVADLIEPGRQFPKVEILREYAEQDLDLAVLKALDSTICFLIEKGQKVYPLTMLARNDYLERVMHHKNKEESV